MKALQAKSAREQVVSAQAQNGATALHNAAGGGYDNIVKVLLAAKADTDIQNSNCNTALHLAAGKGARCSCLRTPLLCVQATCCVLVFFEDLPRAA